MAPPNDDVVEEGGEGEGSGGQGGGEGGGGVVRLEEEKELERKGGDDKGLDVGARQVEEQGGGRESSPALLNDCSETGGRLKSEETFLPPQNNGREGEERDTKPAVLNDCSERGGRLKAEEALPPPQDNGREGGEREDNPALLNDCSERGGRLKSEPTFLPPQDTGYSWVVLAAAFMLALHYSCLLSHFGIFLVEYMEYFDVRKSSLVWIGSLLTSLGFIFGNVSSLLIKKYGFRRFGFAAGLGACVSFVVTASAPNVAVLYLGSGVGASLSFINMFLMSMVAVQCYFDKRRALASGVHTAGLSVGVFIWPFVSRLLIDHYGWRGAMALLGALQLQTLVYSALIRPVSFGKKRKPAKTNKKSSSKLNATTEEMTQLSNNNPTIENGPMAHHSKTEQSESTSKCADNVKSTCSVLAHNTVYPLKKFYPVFPIALLGFVMMQCGFINFYMMIPTFASDLHISKDEGGRIVSIFGAVSGVFRVIIGFIGDRTNSSLMLALAGIVGGVLSVMCMVYTNYVHLVVYAALYSTSSAAYMVLVTPVMRGIVGIENLSSAVGTVAFFIGFDHLITLFIAGLLYEWTDFVAYNFVLYGVVQIISGFIFIFLFVIQRKAKRNNLEIREQQINENGEATT